MTNTYPNLLGIKTDLAKFFDPRVPIDGIHI